MDYQAIDLIFVKLIQIQTTLNRNLSVISRKYGLNQTEMMIYLDIKTYPDTDLNGLCRRLGLKKSAASKALDILVNKGHVTRTVNSSDARKLALRHVELLDQNLCRSEIIDQAFDVLNARNYNLAEITKMLDATLELLRAGDEKILNEDKTK